MEFYSGSGSTNTSDVTSHFETRCVSALDRHTGGHSFNDIFSAVAVESWKTEFFISVCINTNRKCFMFLLGICGPECKAAALYGPINTF